MKTPVVRKKLVYNAKLTWIQKYVNNKKCRILRMKINKANRERVKEALNKKKALDFNSHHVFSWMRYSFNLSWNVWIDWACLIWVGNLFQTWAPEKTNAVWPLAVFIFGITIPRASWSCIMWTNISAFVKHELCLLRYNSNCYFIHERSCIIINKLSDA